MIQAVFPLSQSVWMRRTQKPATFSLMLVQLRSHAKLSVHNVRDRVLQEVDSTRFTLQSVPLQLPKFLQMWNGTRINRHKVEVLRARHAIYVSGPRRWRL